MKPAPLRELRHKKGWRLVHVSEQLIKRGTPVSWPILINIDRGYKVLILRDNTKKIISIQIKKYNPSRHTKNDIAKLFKVKPQQIYADRSGNQPIKKIHQG